MRCLAVFIAVLACATAASLPWSTPPTPKAKATRMAAASRSASHVPLPAAPASNSTAPGCPADAIPYPLPDFPSPAPASWVATTQQLDIVFDHVFSAAAANATGAVVQVAYKDKVIYTYTHGTTGSKPVDENSVFAIGSVSKLFPTLMLHSLRDAGTVALNQQVTEVEPRFKPKANPRSNTARGVSLADLGSHMSGLPRYAPCVFGDCPITLEQALDGIANWTLMSPPGTTVSYSNTGFSVLGRVLGAAAGTTFEDYCTQHVVKPLGMTSTFFTPPTTNPNITKAFADGQEMPPLDLGFSTPAGGIWSSAADMTKLLQAIVRTGEAAGSRSDQILDGATLTEWLNRRVLSDGENVKDQNVMWDSWGIPWEVFRASNSKASPPGFTDYFIVSKDGSVPGWETQIALLPEMHLSVFSSMTTAAPNSGGPFDNDIIIETAFRIIPAVGEFVAAAAAPPAGPSDIQEFIGEYEASTSSAYVATVAADAAGTGLLLTMPNFVDEFPLSYLDGDTFQMYQAADVCLVRQNGNDDYVVQFSRDAAHNISQFLIEGLVPTTFLKR